MIKIQDIIAKEPVTNDIIKLKFMNIPLVRHKVKELLDNEELRDTDVSLDGHIDPLSDAVLDLVGEYDEMVEDEELNEILALAVDTWSDEYTIEERRQFLAEMKERIKNLPDDETKT